MNDRYRHLLVLGFFTSCFTWISPARATEWEGYTEPLRTLQIASDESGTVAEVLIHEGDTVEQGQSIVRLNSQIHEAQLEIARQQMSSTGRLEAAQAELELTSQRLEKIRSLRSSGHARQAEVARAEKEWKVAGANVQAVTEELATRRLDYQRLQAQLDRRIIRAPVAGVITEIHRQLGEYVAPNRPDVVTLVQLNELLAHFALMPEQTKRLKVGQTVELYFPDSDRVVPAKITFISPINDAESGTTLVKAKFRNPDRRFRSGERCVIRLKD